MTNAAMIVTPESLINGVYAKNVLINGNFDIWQRANTVSGLTSNGYFAADRWRTQLGTGATSYTLSRESFAAGQTDVPGEPTYYHRYTQNGTSTGTGLVEQRIEDVRTFAGQTCALSFYAKVASGTLLVTPQISQLFGSGGSSAVDNTGSPVSLDTDWQQFVQTFDIASISGKTIGTDSYLALQFFLPVGSGFAFDLAQVQLELGPNATPFEQRPIEQELALCQRYYQKLNYGLIGGSNGSDNVKWAANFPVEMRIAPTTTALLENNPGYLEVGGSSFTGSSSTLLDAIKTTRGLEVAIDGFSGLTAGRAGYAMDTRDLISVDAEL